MKKAAGENAVQAAHLMERLERLTRRNELEDRLSPSQLQALRYLSMANRFSRTPAALADYVGSTRTTASRTVASLQVSGYIARPSNKASRARTDLSLTSKAKKALQRDPVLALARDIQDALGEGSAQLAQNLNAILREALHAASRRPFGLCRTCRHFRRDAHVSAALPHHCALVNEPLSAADSRLICAEQEPAN